MKKFKVAAIQMVSSPTLADNLRDAEALIVSAAQQGAALVVLPEFFAIMGWQEQDKLALAEVEGEGPIQTFLSRMAKTQGIWLIGGAIPLVASVSHKVRNSCLVYNNQGQPVARYDKLHLFNLQLGAESYQESNTIEAGDVPVVVDTPFGRIGLGICYDLRFPELFRQMPALDLLVIPAAFTQTTGEAHWEVLLRARAIENQVYLIASAQGGAHLNGRKTYGHSMVVDPWGKILSCLPSGSGVVMAEIDPHYCQQLRQSLPALQNRRF